jgi:16S rRNA (guanine527-N7)-methyltransferase
MTAPAPDLERLRRGAAAFDLRLDDAQLERFRRLADLLEDWNRRFNLTRIPPEETVALHFLDSLSVARAHPLRPALLVIDVGTGAGFPGLPLKIACPGIDLVLLDATRKKLRFLEAAAEALGLEGVEIVHGRAEEFGRDPLRRERFDLVVARAVARLPALAEYLLPLAKVGGTALAMKTAPPDEEIAEARAAIAALGGEIEAVARVVLPETGIERALISLRKRRPTPARYPRPNRMIAAGPIE